MIPTPRTDALCRVLSNQVGFVCQSDHIDALVHLCLALERDLARALADREGHAIFSVSPVTGGLFGVVCDRIAAPYLWSFDSEQRAENLARELNRLVAPLMNATFTNQEPKA